MVLNSSIIRENQLVNSEQRYSSQQGCVSVFFAQEHPEAARGPTQTTKSILGTDTAQQPGQMQMLPAAMENYSEQYYFKVFNYIKDLQKMLGLKLLLRIVELVDDTGSAQASSDSTLPGSSDQRVNTEEEPDLRSQYEQQFLREMQAKRYEQLKYYFQNRNSGGAGVAMGSRPSIQIQDIKQVKTRLSKRVLQKTEASRNVLKAVIEEADQASSVEKDCADDWFYEAKEMAGRCIPFFCKQFQM